MSRVNRIICGDSLEVLRGLPEKSVDLVFGSPPYENARDLIDDSFPVLTGEEWVKWMVPVCKASLRISRGLVAFVIQGRTKKFRWSATPCLLATDLHRAGIHLRDFIIYNRIGVPGSGSVDWLRHDCEYVLCATNGGRLSWSDNTAMGHPPKWGPGGEMSHRLSSGARVNQWGGSKGKKKYGRKQNGTTDENIRPSRKYERVNRPRAITRRNQQGVRSDKIYHPPTLSNPGNLIACGSLGLGRMGSKLAHKNEAPFSEKLAEFFIKSFCPPGGVVCDPFSGSGTTAAVAKRFGRSWIAIDIRESQCDLTRERLKEVRRGK